MRTFILSFLLVVSACKHRPPNVAVPQNASPSIGANAGPASSIDPATRAAIDAVVANFGRVYFALDSARLDESAREALEDNARILRDHPSIRVEVQGHADERGTVDYNLALGARRADSVSRALESMGVESMRLRTISLGEEQPLADGAGEVAWSRNRRCEFRVTAGSGAAGTTGG